MHRTICPTQCSGLPVKRYSADEREFVNNFEIMEAATDADYDAAKALIEEYVGTLRIDLSFQSFAEELASLRKLYGPPEGNLLLARMNAQWAGCVAVRNKWKDACEMKRLYVRPQFRQSGLGKCLAEAAIQWARRLAYTRMLLDTLPNMTVAQSLYRKLGFREIEPYYSNPVEGTRYFVLELGPSAGA